MTVKDGDRFLQAALDSLATQTFRDFRLLACDDGSVDRTAELFLRERRFPVVFVRNAVNQGISASVNSLLELPSDARYIARVDGDDLCAPTRFAKQIDYLDTHPEIGVLGTHVTLIDTHGLKSGSLKVFENDPELRVELLFNCPILQPSVMLRASLMRNHKIRYDPSLRTSEDYDMWCRLSNLTRLANLPEELTSYRRHVSSSYLSSRHEDALAVMRGVRLRHIERLPLMPTGRVLLSRALGLQPASSSVMARVGDIRKLLLALDTLFLKPGLTSHALARRNEIGLLLLLGLGGAKKFGLLLRDGRLRRAYLREKYRQAIGMKRERRKADLARTRLARAIRRQILASHGSCEDDFRIYGFAGAPAPSFAESTVIEHGCSLWFPTPTEGGDISLKAGENLFVGFNTRINVYAPVVIGRQVFIGANSYIASNNHRYSRTDIAIQNQGFIGASVTIGDDVWIGCHVVILPGVTIGQGAVIGAGSVVTRDVPSYEVWAGVPAKKIKSR